MNDTIRMQISAFVDGELPDNESELLLRRLSQDAELRQIVARYLEIGRYVRRDGEVERMSHLRGRIAEALGEETQVIPAAHAPVSRKFVKPLLGFAVAATVALLAIISLRQADTPLTSDEQSVAENGSYTQLSADMLLDEMFRRHENSPLIQRVTYDFDEAELVEVESQAKLLPAVELNSEIEQDVESKVEPDVDHRFEPGDKNEQQTEPQTESRAD